MYSSNASSDRIHLFMAMVQKVGINTAMEHFLTQLIHTRGDPKTKRMLWDEFNLALDMSRIN